MTPTEISDEFEDKDLRCEVIYPIFAIPFGSLIGHDLAEIIMNYDESLNRALGITDKDFDEFTHADFIEAFLCEKDKKGFVGKFAKPIATKFSGDNFENYYSSWGYYQTQWFYSYDLNGVFAQAIQWAREQHVENRAKFIKELNEKTI